MTSAASETDGETEADAGASGPEIRDLYYASPDGLRLHAREYGDRTSPWTPVICLPGLTRSDRDFEELARHLSQHRHRPRRVICMNYRGRSKSEWDTRPDNYNPIAEMHDVYAGMAALDIPRAVIVGASRGGIIGMLMGTDRPAALAGLVLVDIGPVIEPLGLARIKSYVGRLPIPDNWADAAHILKRLHGGRFATWTDKDWDYFARLSFRDDDGLPVSDYDPKLADTLDGIEFDQPVPDLWTEFGSLDGKPILAIRGETSDVLSAETLEAMAERHSGLDTLTVPDEGHFPLLRGGNILKRISSFITGLEGSHPPADAILPEKKEPFDLDAEANAKADD